ncbi:hypothetical protein [Snodgrassella gandavensis]|uniref:hypothetical protein n=1 Tax=Snodgrassella gandavensis TaxID=2946698 RepID=UPI001EF50608|nr:hypothetical protein [Snodgrassella gandavensis]
MPANKEQIHLDYHIPDRGLIGFKTEFLTMASATALFFNSDSLNSTKLTNRRIAGTDRATTLSLQIKMRYVKDILLAD